MRFVIASQRRVGVIESAVAMERIRRGWRLAKQSLKVVWSDPALAVLVVMGFVLAALVALPLMIAGGIVSEGDEPSAAAWILIGIGVYLGYTVTIFFGVGIVHAAGFVLDGDATVGESIGFAVKRLGPILGWSVVGTPSLLLAFLRSRGVAGAILAGIGEPPGRSSLSSPSR